MLKNNPFFDKIIKNTQTKHLNKHFIKLKIQIIDKLKKKCIHLFSPNIKKMKYKQIIITIILFIFLAINIHTYVSSGNSASRFATIEMIVEKNTFIIDNSTFMGDAKMYEIKDKQNLPLMRLNNIEAINGTNDKILVKNKFYSDKTVNSALIATPIYALLYKLGMSFSNKGELVVFLLTLLFSTIPTIIIAIIFYKSLKFTKIPKKYEIPLSLMIILSTLLFPYGTVFNNHTLAALFISIAFYIILKNSHKEEIKKNNYFTIGLFSGLAASIDLVAGGLFLICSSIYFLNKTKYNLYKNKQIFMFFILGILPILIIHTIFTIPITGDILPGSVHPEYWKYNGSNFNENNLSGTGLKHNSIGNFFIYLFHTLLGFRGFFSYTPYLLVGIFLFFKKIYAKKTIVEMRTKKKIKIEISSFTTYKKELILWMCFSASTIIFYAITTNGYGGWSYGMRWFVPLIFGLYFMSSLFFEENKLFKKNRINMSTIIIILLIIIGIFTSVVGVIEPWTEMWKTQIPLLNNLYVIAKKLPFKLLWF